MNPTSNMERRLRLTEAEIGRATDMVLTVMQRPALPETRNVVRKGLAALPMSLRTAAHVVHVVRRVAALMTDANRAAMGPDSWLLIFMVVIVVCDKMVEDRETTVAEWAQFFKADAAELASAEFELMAALHWDVHVTTAALDSLLDEIMGHAGAVGTGIGIQAI